MRKDLLVPMLTPGGAEHFSILVKTSSTNDVLPHHPQDSENVHCPFSTHALHYYILNTFACADDSISVFGDKLEFVKHSRGSEVAR